MGTRKILLPIAMVLSALSALTGILPFIFIWLIVKELFGMVDTVWQGSITHYAWWAAGSAIVSVIFYFMALMSSHLAAFRVETNLRREAMQKIIRMPLGFFENNTSGRIRKIIDDNAGITHSFLAHQLPDLSAAIISPIATITLIFIFDWQLGLACLMPIIVSFAIMMSMMGTKSRQFMKSYINKALGKLTEGKTVLMIAHRLTSIADADNILVIDKGKIAEQGTHKELLAKQGIYLHMWNEYQQSVRWTIGKEARHA